MPDRKEEYKEYNRKRMEDPERRKVYLQQISSSIMRRYHSDPEWREEFKRKQRERNAKKKLLLAQS
jgi:hypothetical protein